MSQITFLHLSIRNFISWERLNFRLHDRGSVCLRGLNGAGKSSIFKALYWCLFGVLPEAVKADEVRAGKKPTRVKLTMQKGHHVYTLIRHRGHPLFKNRLEFSGHGIPITDADSLIKDVQQLVNDFLGITPDVFLTTTFFAQRNFHIFHSLSDTGKKEWLEANTYGSLFSECERLIREHTRALERTLDYDEGRLRGLEESFTIAKAAEERKRSTSRAAIKELRQKHELIQSQLQDVNDELERLKRLPLEYSTAHEDYQKKEIIYDRAVAIKHNLAQQETVCSACGAKIDAVKHAAALKKLEHEVDVAAQAFRASQHAFIAIEKRYAYYTDLQDSMEQYTQAAKKLSSEVKALERELAKLDETKELQQSITTLKRSIRVQQIKQTYYRFWVNGFGFQGLRSYALRTAAQYLLERLRYYLGQLVGVRFQVDLEFINNRISISFNNNRSYASLSGGERQAVDLATGFALRDVAERYNKCRFNLMILDEPFENLDDSLTTAAQSMFAAIERDSIFFITHRPINSNFSRVLRIEKHFNHSKLIVES